MIKAGVIGATGYTGVELVRILSHHPDVEIVGISSQTYEGQNFSDVFPSMVHINECVLKNWQAEELADICDVIFLALPHGLSMETAKNVIAKGKKVIDLSGDFRFDLVETYEKWYKVNHTAQELLAVSVYGLPEINRSKISEASIAGNPGCFPTSIILGLAPLLKNNIIDASSIIADSKSGVSGGGRGLNIAFHYAECSENFKAYNIGCHRHTPEIEQELSKLAGQDLTLSFTPHLVPMTRGILSTLYADLINSFTAEELLELYCQFYKNEYFIRIYPDGKYPQTKWVYGSNFCDIGLMVDSRTNRVVVVSAIDNLVKGASGQAVQNMNIMFGLPEKNGLDFAPVFP